LTYFFQINLNLSHLNQFKKQMVWDQKNVGVPLNVLNYGKIIIYLLCVGFKQLNKYIYIYIFQKQGYLIIIIILKFFFNFKINK